MQLAENWSVSVTDWWPSARTNLNRQLCLVAQTFRFICSVRHRQILLNTTLLRHCPYGLATQPRWARFCAHLFVPLRPAPNRGHIGRHALTNRSKAPNGKWSRTTRAYVIGLWCMLAVLVARKVSSAPRQSSGHTTQSHTDTHHTNRMY